MSRHTPGPWLVREDRSHGPTISQRGGYAIARTYDQCGPDGIPAHDADANACLIAAAPDTFEALKPFAYLARVMREGEILNHRGVYITWEQAEDAAAAIAKAEGADGRD